MRRHLPITDASAFPPFYPDHELYATYLSYRAVKRSVSCRYQETVLCDAIYGVEKATDSLRRCADFISTSRIVA